MNATALIRQLAGVGVRLSRNGERLKVEAPSGTVTPELRALIANRKTDLLVELTLAARDAKEVRRARVEAALRDRPEQRAAFDVTDAPMTGETGAPVSVMLAVRHGEHILTGELRLPRQRWDVALFLRTIDPGQERPS